MAGSFFSPEKESSQFHAADDRVFTGSGALSSSSFDSDDDFCMLTPSQFQEHVLRDVSNGSDPTSRQSRPRSSSVVTNPYEDQPVQENTYHGKSRTRSGYSKYSPTPSIKRGKAEKLLKEHGSPPNWRVTAGGRVIVNGPPGIKSPYFSQGAPYKVQNYNRIARPYTSLANTPPSALSAMNGMVVDCGGGVLAQLVDGVLQMIDFRNGIAQFPIPLRMPSPTPPPAYGSGMAAYPGYPFIPPTAMQIPVVPGPNFTPPTAPNSDDLGVDASSTPTMRQIRVMEQVHTKLEQELKDLDRNEVLQRGSLNASAKAEIVRTRMDLVNRIDASRRGINEAKRLVNAKAPSTNANLDGTASSAGLGIYGSRLPGLGLDAYFGTQQALLGYGQMPFSAPLYPLNSPKSTPAVPTNVVPQFNTPQGAFDFAHQVGPFSGINNMQQAATNVGYGTDTASMDIRGSNETGNTYPSNLDGSVHQPRRSHAIEIKPPKEVATQNKSGLNPTSPSYQPSQMSGVGSQNNDDEVSVFVPSPTLVAQVDKMVQSPGSDRYGLDETASARQSSGNSVTTADFFPTNTNQHSARNFSASARDIHVNLPAWMNDIRAMTAIAGGTNPNDAQTNSIWTITPSDHESLQPTGQAQFRRPSTAAECVSPPNEGRSCDLDFISQAAFSHISPATKQQQSAHLRESSIVAETTTAPPGLHHKVSTASFFPKNDKQCAPMQVHTSPMKSDDYWEGYKTGIKQAVLGNNTTNDYRTGYRDGMIQSNACVPEASTKMDASRISTFGSNINTRREDFGSRRASVSRSEGVSQFKVPVVPNNSLATTPTAQRSVHDRFPTSPDSPRMNADLMAQPNINLGNSLSGDHRAYGHPMNVTFRPADPLSPLANRSATKSKGDMMGSNDANTGKVQGRTAPYDYQRFQKGKPSVAQSDNSARAFMSGQSDGSALNNDKTMMLAESYPYAATPLSPRSRMSPVRSAATAAVASIAHLTRSVPKKEQKPARIPSPERHAWRSKFKVNNTRNQGEDEIEEYKKKFAGM